MEPLKHHIQRDIVKTLCFCTDIRFSKLKPKNLESNIFMYHLKQLIKMGLVEKSPSGAYQLSSKGLAYVDKLSLYTKRPALQPKTVVYLQILDKKGSQLYWRRKIQPSINRVGVPIGKLHHGEDIKDSAKRELLEKTGLDNVDLEYRGIANLKFLAGDVLISNIICFVFIGQAKTIRPKLISGERGDVFWSNKPQTIDLLPSVPFMNAIINNVSNSTFFVEKSFNLD